MTDREALQIAFNALVEIDRESPYPIAKHAIKCINAAFNTEQEKRPDYCGSGHCSCIECPFGMDQKPIGYADVCDLEDEGMDFYVNRQPGKRAVPVYLTPPSKPLTDEDKEILDAVRRELSRGNRNGDAPGHSHQVPGIWDSDNGDRAGKPCAWCLTWKKFTAIIDCDAALRSKNT